MSLLQILIESLTSEAISRGIIKLFPKDSFKTRLYKIIQETIDEFDSRANISYSGSNFPFHLSQCIVDELLKFRLFKNSGYIFNGRIIQEELLKNPNIIPPTAEDMQLFLSIFQKKITEDEILKKLAIDEFHNEEIYAISDKITELNEKIENKFTEIDTSTRGEFHREINECKRNLENFKPQTALDWLKKLETQILENEASKSLLGNIYFVEALCFDLLSRTNDAWLHYIKAYKQNPSNLQFQEKAVFAYFYLKDESAEIIADKVIQLDDYNIYAWFVKTIKNEKLVNFIQEHVPRPVTVSSHFQRLVWTYLVLNNRPGEIQILQEQHFLPYPDYESVPERITYDNFQYWQFIINVSLTAYFNTEPINFSSLVPLNPKIEYLYKFLERFNLTIEGSEIEKNYEKFRFFFLWSQCEIQPLINNIIKFEEAYNNLKSKNNLETLLLANILQKYYNNELALKYLDSFYQESDISILALKVYCLLRTNDIERIKTGINLYIQQTKNIDQYNIVILLDFITMISKDEGYLQEVILRLEEIPFDNNALKVFFFGYAKSLFEELSCVDEIYASIKDFEKEIFNNYPILKTFIAQTYFNLKKYPEVIDFLDPWVDKTKQSGALYLYIDTLINSKSNQLDLLHLLEYWRENISYIDYFVRKEIHLRQIIQDWKKIEDIAVEAYKRLENKELYFSLVLTSLEVNSKNDEIKKWLPELKKIEFSDYNNLITIAGILVRQREFDLALEITYPIAKDPKNSIARQNYLGLILHIPGQNLVEYQTVVVDSVVKYTYKGNILFIEVDNQTIQHNQIAAQLIGKNKGEKISIKKPMTGEKEEITILRIMNKYLGLHDEILEEINNPLSGLPFESVEFPQNLTKEKLKEFFVSKFGAEGTERKLRVEEEINNYQNYKISFGELTARVFQEDYLAAFYTMTVPPSEGYRVTPTIYLNSLNGISGKKFVLDYTSGLLFFEISKELDVCFDQKFLVSNSFQIDLARRISEEEHGLNTELMVNITLEGISPVFLPKDYKKNRVQLLRDFSSWLGNNTMEIVPESKLTIVSQLDKKTQKSYFLNHIFDNIFLVSQTDAILISDDSFYYRTINPKSGRITSTESFLIEAFPSKNLEIQKFLLKRNFIGLTPSKELLIYSFENRLSGMDRNMYNKVLLSLSVGEKSSKTIIDTLEFIKYLTTHSILPVNELAFQITNIFVHLLRGIFNRRMLMFVKEQVMLKFYLLPEQKNLVLLCLLDAIRTIKGI